MRAIEGPWIYEYGAVYHKSKGRVMLADRDNDKTVPTERDANCRLCAAAPDLLAACEAVLEWAKTPGDHGGNPYTKEFVKLAERAITKARGG